MLNLGAILVLFVSMASFGARAQQQVSKGCCVAMALDESTSLTEQEFTTITGFVSDVIDNFEHFGKAIDGESAAVCTFATRLKVVFGLDAPHTRKQASDKVRNLLMEGGSTNTHLAIIQLQQFLTVCNPEFNKAGLIITDGNSNDPPLTLSAARTFKSNGYLLIVVGIGNINPSEMVSIASPNLFFPVADTASLGRISLEIENVICSQFITTTTTPRPQLPPGSCLECEFINGLYLFRNKQNCYVYNQCLSWTQAVPFERPCPFGQFFEPVSATCMPAGQVDCPEDRCKGANVQSYPNHRVCSAYFICTNLRTTSEACCAVGQRFVQGSGCVTDATCTDLCNPDPKDQPCLSRADPNDPTKYQENIAPGIWITRDCAPGTSFVTAECECTAVVSLGPAPACEHELYLPFDENEQDYQYRRYVTNSPPEVSIVSATGATGGKAALFGGSSRLLVKSYDNAWFGQELVIRTRFRESDTSSPPGGSIESLFGNGDCTRKGSIEVTYDRSNNVVNARLVTLDSGGNEVVTTASVSNVNSGSWKNVEFRYDGSNLKLTVDSVDDESPAAGNVATRHAALQIGGGCLDNEYLYGLEDEFYVYPCLP